MLLFAAAVASELASPAAVVAPGFDDTHPLPLPIALALVPPPHTPLACVATVAELHGTLPAPTPPLAAAVSAAVMAAAHFQPSICIFAQRAAENV